MLQALVGLVEWFVTSREFQVLRICAMCIKNYVLNRMFVHISNASGWEIDKKMIYLNFCMQWLNLNWFLPIKWKVEISRNIKAVLIAVKIAIPGILLITKRINGKREIPHCFCRNLWCISILNIACSTMGFHSSPSQKESSRARESSERRIEGDLKVWYRKNEKDRVFVCLFSAWEKDDCKSTREMYVTVVGMDYCLSQHKYQRRAEY